MFTAIYRSSKKEEMYVYFLVEHLKAPTQEEQDHLHQMVLPVSLHPAIGRLTYVMSIDLEQRQHLARVDIQQVRLSLMSKGYFVQTPPDGLIQLNVLAPEGLRGA